MLRLLFGLLLLFFAGEGIPAAPLDPHWSRIQALFPEADHLGMSYGPPSSTQVLAGGRLLGHVFQTKDIVRIPAYSGLPINLLVGVEANGRLRGVAILEHEEPILKVGVSEQDLQRFTAQYRGLMAGDDIRIGGRAEPGRPIIDGISSATITAMVINRTLVQAAGQVAQARELFASRATPNPQPDGLEPLWVEAWRHKPWEIGILGLALAALLGILLFQDWLARHPHGLRRLRTGFLFFTLVGIGWFGLGQLSVVHVLTFVHSVLHGFSWEGFLLDPVLFLLWSFVAFTLLLWGRGVYCGWLCPFGALQELLSRLARRLGIPQWEVPDVLHERLWALKYLVLLGLFGLSLQSLGKAELYAEVEPFKTAFGLRFMRDWPFVLYALGVLGAGLVVRKAYCRYLCPLGAALTFPGRFRIFEWLRRRKECGRPCQICARECEVGAIRPTGEIIDNECHYCLDCQVTYWDEHKCPPLVEHRKKVELRERFGSAKSSRNS